MNLPDYLDETGVVLDISGSNKEEILAGLVESLAKLVAVDKNAVVELLKEREKLSTTGIGCEVAIPHCRTAEVEELKIVIARSKEGIDFKALDGKPVRLFFLLIAPEKSNSEHLKALAKIAKLAKDREIRERLLSIDTPKGVVQFLIDREANF